jgi:osmotically-inducible protein OsmY
MKNDVLLQRHVLEELDWEPSVDAEHVGVTVEGGVVALTGHVPVYAEKHAAEEVVKRVHGVRAVANDIEVRPTGLHVRDDADIAAAALHALEWDSKVPDDRLQLTVREGWVVLDGTVEAQYQKAAAERAVRHLVGTRGVSNNIRVTRWEVPHGEFSAEIKTSIEAALLRSATLNSKRIRVETDGDVVILTGDVHSHVELEEAERMAWTARGVHHVNNCLTITPWGSGPAEEWGY